MRTTEFWLWWIPDRRGRLRRSTWRMTADDAQARYPGAERVEGSLEVRDCPESPEDAQAISTSSFVRRPGA